jgi:hypothetical protein
MGRHERVPYHCECGATHHKGKIWLRHYHKARQFVIDTKDFIKHHNEVKWY